MGPLRAGPLKLCGPLGWYSSMQGMDYAVDALAVYRVTRLVQEDTFPPVEAARAAVMKRVSRDGAVEELFTCTWCMSVWVAAAVFLARRFAPRAWRPLAFIMAASAVTGFVSERT
jgi:hypothetical protein